MLEVSTRNEFTHACYHAPDMHTIIHKNGSTVVSVSDQTRLLYHIGQGSGLLKSESGTL